MFMAIAKLGSREMLGQYALGISIATPVLMLTQFNLRSVLATDVQAYGNFRDYRQICLASLAITLVTIAGFLNRMGYEPATFLVAACLGIEYVSEIYHGLLQKHERMNRIAISLILRGLLSVFLLAIGLTASGDLVIALAAMLTGRLAILLLYDASVAVRDDLAEFSAPPNWHHQVEIVRTAIPLGIVMCLGSLTLHIPRYAITHYIGETELGAFAAIASLARSGGFVVNALGQAATPKFARMVANNDDEAFRRLSWRMVALGVALGLLGCIAVILWGKQILGIIYRSEYGQYHGLFLALMIACGLGYVTSLLSYTITAARRFRVQLPIYVATAIVTAMAAYLLVPQWGLVGAAAGITAGMMVQVLCQMLVIADVSRKLRMATSTIAASTEKRILLLLTSLSADGGAEVQTRQLAVHLKKNGWDVHLISLMPPESVPADLATAEIPVDHLDVHNGLDVFRALVRLDRMIQSFKPAIVHAHMTHAVLAARLVRLFHRVPVVIGTLHGLRMYNVAGTGWRVREFAHRLTDRLCDVTTVVCEAARKQYLASKAISTHRLRVVPNGTDLEKFYSDSSRRAQIRTELGLKDEFVFLSAGRLDPIKNHAMMLQSFAKIARSRRDIRLCIVGRGQLEDALRSLSLELGIEPQVQFLGWRSDVEFLMNAADCLLLTSKFEALPLVLLEAAASELPAIATDVGGNVEAVVSGQTGLLAPADDIEAFANRMQQILAMSAPERAEMGRTARAHVQKKYELASVVQQWESLYRELLSAKSFSA